MVLISDVLKDLLALVGIETTEEIQFYRYQSTPTGRRSVRVRTLQEAVLSFPSGTYYIQCTNPVLSGYDIEKYRVTGLGILVDINKDGPPRVKIDTDEEEIYEADAGKLKERLKKLEEKFVEALKVVVDLLTVARLLGVLH